MSFENLDFAYHGGVGNKFTYTLNWTQILLILCRHPNKVYLIKMLNGFVIKSTRLKQVLGQKLDSLCSVFDFDTGFTSDISIFKAHV